MIEPHRSVDHDEDSVCNLTDLVDVTGEDHHAGSLGGEFTGLAGNVPTGPDVDSAEGFVEEHHAGALGDPVAALLTCSPGRAWFSLINGRLVVDEGNLVDIDVHALVGQHNRVSLKLLHAAGLA